MPTFLNRAMRCVLATALIAGPAAAKAQTSSPALSATERTIVKSVDAHNADALALLIKVVNINSGTMNFAGVIDMKGGDVIIVYALRALKEAKQLDRMNITIVFDGDEEESGTPLELA